jgi:DNA invertase Pin-like site-specific DNA recombinase
MTRHTRTISADTAPDWTGESLIRAPKAKKSAPPPPSAKPERMHFEERRKVVSEMYSAGNSTLDIAVKLKCSTETITSDLRATKKIPKARTESGDPSAAILALKAFCKREGVEEAVIYDASDKGKKTALVRSDCMLEMREASKCQYAQIAKIVGRPASNVTHSIKKALNRRD